MSADSRLTKLPVIVTLAGAGTLAIEMVAPRLLAPAFGTSQPIWAAVIGMTLLYLAIGYHLGGRCFHLRQIFWLKRFSLSLNCCFLFARSHCGGALQYGVNHCLVFFAKFSQLDFISLDNY
jgi:hypothetical protein